MLKIRNFETSERATLQRDVCHNHPEWIHQQLGTTGEPELQSLLDCIDVQQMEDNAPCKNCCGIYAFEA